MNERLSQFYESYGQTNGLFYMGHASVLAVFGGRKILFDPVILSTPYGDAWTFFPPQIKDPRVFEVDAVVVSHIHQDHYDVQFLLALPASTKVIIVGGRPALENDMRKQGVKNLHVIEPEVVAEIFDRVFFYGVTHEVNGIDSSAIVFNDAFCVYHGNDNYLTPPSMQKFKQVRDRIDVACIPYAFIHWYPFLVEYDADEQGAKEAESTRLVNMYMQHCIDSARILEPAVLIPFGANLLLDDGDCYSPINMAVRTPLEFCDYARRTDPVIGAVAEPMLAGDYCAPSPDDVIVNIAREYGVEEYRAEANAFLNACPQREDSREWKLVDEATFIANLNQKLQDIEDGIDEVIRIDLSYLGKLLKVQVDCHTRQAAFVEDFTGDADYHHYTLDPIASGEWLNGKRFEEIIGMRRFTLRRQPNVYKLPVLRMMTTVL